MIGPKDCFQKILYWLILFLVESVVLDLASRSKEVWGYNIIKKSGGFSNLYLPFGCLVVVKRELSVWPFSRLRWGST